MTTQIVAKPSGMVTEPNKVGQFPPGAFAYCENVAIRSFGVMEQVQTLSDMSGWTFAGPLVGGFYAVSEGALTVFLYEHTTPGTWAVSALIVSSFGGTWLTTRNVDPPHNAYITSDARTGVVLMRNRLVITGAVRSFVVDLYPSYANNVVAVGLPRDCGVYQSSISNRTSSNGGLSTDPAVLGPGEHFSATSVLRVKFTDGYEIQSPPNVPYDYANLSTTVPQIRSTWTIQSDIPSAGYFNLQEIKHDVYRTRAQSVGYDNVNNKYIPVSTGSSFYLSKSVSRISASQTNIVDYTLPSTLGEALLTNVSVGGPSALPLPPPPIAKSSAAFRGHAFYANRWDPATFTLLNPYFWGYIDLATVGTFSRIDQGIGIRFVSGGLTATSGSPTVTGFPDVGGVVAGQTFNVYRVDTGALVSSNNQVLSVSSGSVTGTSNISYSGTVRADIIDRIEVCGVNVAALSSPQDFVGQLFASSVDMNLILDVVAVGLEPSTANNPAGFYPNFVPTGGMTFRMRTTSPFTIRATNGHLFSPALPAINVFALSIPGRQLTNSFAWSENNEPENVPPSNYAFCGNGEIYKIIPTRDCLWFFCSDGLFRLSGSGGSAGTEYDWAIDPVDPSVVITNPMCAVSHREYVYAMTSRGFISISSEGIVRELSDGRINPAWLEGNPWFLYGLRNQPWRPILVPTFSTFGQTWVASDLSNDEVWVRTYATNDLIWVYNVKTDTWCIRKPSYAAALPGFGIYNDTGEMLVLLYENSNKLVISARIGNSANYELAKVLFQPFYGGSHGAPYTQKHWQDINLSFSTPLTVPLGANTPVSTCTLRSQGPAFYATVSAGTRLIPLSYPNGMEKSRVGFSIPRNFPAVANSIQPYLEITSPSASGNAETNLQPIKLEGMQISYIDFTDQRVAR